MNSSKHTNAPANRWSAVHQASSATPKYVPMHKRPSGPSSSSAFSSSSSSSSTSSRSSDASSSRASSPTPSSISSMSSVASMSSSPRTKYQPSKASMPPTNTTQTHPLIYTPTHLMSMRPLALESVKERMRTACPEVTMNRRQRKGLEYAASQARKAARESGSGMSSSSSGSSVGASSVASSSVAGSDVGSPSPAHAPMPSFNHAEASDDEEEEEVELLQPIASDASRPTASRITITQPTTSGRRQGLPGDLPQGSWRALHRLGVPVLV